IGKLLKGSLNTSFPENVKYGNIVSGLPVEENSCDGIYSSHTLEHLSFKDFDLALKNTFKILKPRGKFRCIVPDLEILARNYVKALDNGDVIAGEAFIRSTLMGTVERPQGLKAVLSSIFGNSNHLWMWDSLGFKNKLTAVGFTELRDCSFNDSVDPMFKLVEDKDRFENAIAIECTK
ncbi:MAG: methyltransferase domain-containing protein, partial [Flavobacteriales bacterium]|nr:methyltransferase domain-containing protein [Flavobacteriales bacterium]